MVKPQYHFLWTFTHHWITYLQIALILALALVAPSMASPQFYMRYNNPSTVYRAGSRNAAPVARPEPDLTDLTANFEASKDIVAEAEELSNQIFPNDGKPIVVNNQIRTQFGNAPLPSGNILDPNVRSELKELSDALKAVVSNPKIDPAALNKVLELSRDLSLSYEWAKSQIISSLLLPQ